MNASPQHCGFIALVGAPNAGKSTLLNQLVGQKVAIVSPKVQTTRTRITGITTEDNTQLVFIDTPGIFVPKDTLHKAMVKAAWGGPKDADITVLLVDAKHGITEEVEHIIARLKTQDKPVILALNKTDLLPKEQLLPLVERLNELADFTEIFMVSAKTGDGVAELKTHLAQSLPEAPWMYPEDQASDMPLRLFAAEITREKLFLQLDQELPYGLMVETESWEEQNTESEIQNPESKNSPKHAPRTTSHAPRTTSHALHAITIHQVVYVARKNHKNIVVGKGGSRIKAIGEAARKELEYLLDTRVHLFLFVKVKEDWMTHPESYAAMGLDFPS